MKCIDRMFLNAACSAVFPEGHADAATLYAAPGDEIPDEAAARFGIVDGRCPDDKKRGKAAAKEAKEAKAANKDAGDDANKGGLTVDKGGDKK